MNKHGEVYVRVEANESSPMFMDAGGSAGAGGGGQTGFGVVIKWTFDGGFTESGSWLLNGQTIVPVQGDVNATNAKIAAAAKGMPFNEIFNLGKCAVLA